MFVEAGERRLAAMTHDSRINATNVARKAAPLPLPRPQDVARHAGAPDCLLRSAEELHALVASVQQQQCNAHAKFCI